MLGCENNDSGSRCSASCLYVGARLSVAPCSFFRSGRSASTLLIVLDFSRYRKDRMRGPLTGFGDERVASLHRPCVSLAVKRRDCPWDANTRHSNGAACVDSIGTVWSKAAADIAPHPPLPIVGAKLQMAPLTDGLQWRARLQLQGANGGLVVPKKESPNDQHQAEP